MRKLLVQGHGEVKVDPDKVTLSMNVEGRTKKYDDCLEEMNRRVQLLKQSLEKVGIDRSKILSDNYHVHPAHDYKDGKSKLVGYEARHDLMIELGMDKDLLHRVLLCLAESASKPEVDVDFGVWDEKALRTSVMACAVEDGHAKAQALAKAAGVTLGALQEIHYGVPRIAVHHSSEFRAMRAPMSLFSREKVIPDVAPRPVVATDTVELAYEIV